MDATKKHDDDHPLLVDDVDEDDDEKGQTRITKLLADYDDTIRKSTECLDLSDVKSAALRRKLRGTKGVPAKMMRAIRASIPASVTTSIPPKPNG